ncbi:2-(3-amino-3-carboxypropyl)histidine synthase subunit 2-like [Phlebotomus argentipes]|uniref:2-(3-amino-3-carboxypropyl)histidine synthase subunit 2-like n=1 Tax=Phlebotomus argentipes TaxID=94469 RepID=UPI002893167A|nr:2-(3-amino-3-carboxypropyl)histidine synthase subunit 2-like [Phlebotomus argentipes]
MSSTFYSSDAAIEEDAETTSLTQDYLPTLEETWSEQELQRCKKWIVESGFKRISLQFPDSLLRHSVTIYGQLNGEIEAEFFILGDTSYGSCCVDEVAASHVDSDALIHFGQACLSRNTRLPVLYVFLHLCVKWEDYQVKMMSTFPCGDEKVIIFPDTAFYHAKEELLQQLAERTNVRVASLAVDDSVKANYLCWHVQDLESIDITQWNCLFIGEDDQTFFNLSLAIPAAKWFIYDPKRETLCPATPRTSSWFRRRYYYVEVCKDAQMIGIVMGTLTSSGYLDIAKRIQTLAKERGLRSILISVGKINPAKLANFSDVDCFVLIGCPQNNVFNSRDFYKPILTTFEVELALNPAWKDTIPDTYCVDFQELLPNGKFHREHDPEENLESDVSLITGRVRERNQRPNGAPAEAESALLERESGALVSNRVTEAFRERSWRGLDPALGQDEPARIVEGRSGIPVAYEEHKDERK